MSISICSYIIQTFVQLTFVCTNMEIYDLKPQKENCKRYFVFSFFIFEKTQKTKIL